MSGSRENTTAFIWEPSALASVVFPVPCRPVIETTSTKCSVPYNSGSFMALLLMSGASPTAGLGSGQTEQRCSSRLVPSARPLGKLAITAAGSAQSSWRCCVVFPSTLMLTMPGVVQSVSVATYFGRPPWCVRKLILKAGTPSMQSGKENVADSPASADRIAAALLPLTTTVTGPSDPWSRVTCV